MNLSKLFTIPGNKKRLDKTLAQFISAWISFVTTNLFATTRMHSSRMRTYRLLTVSGGGGLPIEGGGVCL